MSASGAAGANVGPLDVQDVVALPLPATVVPNSFTFTHDDVSITFLHDDSGSTVRQLHVFSTVTGERRALVKPISFYDEDQLPREERLRRERLRERGLGVTSYSWAEHADTLMVPFPDGVYVQHGLAGELQKVVDSSGKALVLSPKLSPDGRMLAYVRDDEVYVIRTAVGQAARQLTSGARESAKAHGLADFIAQEEMDRHHGFWWSKDGQYIAFTQVDENSIPAYRIMHQGKAAVGDMAQEDHRYPFAGCANGRTLLGVITVDNTDETEPMDASIMDEVVWMEVTTNGYDEYVCRVDWCVDNTLVVQLQNRSQTRLEVAFFDITTGRRCAPSIFEESEVWINLHHLFTPLASPATAFIWASERTGFRHLYLYDRAIALSDNTASLRETRILTQGEWVVDSIVRVDELRQLVYFTGNKASAIETHLYRVALHGGDIVQLTKEAGTHTVTAMDQQSSVFVDTFSSIDTPPKVTLRSSSTGDVVWTIHDKADPRTATIGLQPPKLVCLQAHDGTVLYGAVYHPASVVAKPPCIVSVYGGPAVQHVTNSWRMTVDMRALNLSRQGFVVFKLDGRGSARRGVAFEGAIKNNMGKLEIEDQVDGIRWLAAAGLIDATRVGIYGWSYGGYLAAMALVKASDVFHVAVAGAPVTSWDGYDTHYAERYMGTPQSNPEGYVASSVMHHVRNMRGRLMIIHGLIDENVHFRHTARLINALVEADKEYTLLLLPDERHMPRKYSARVYCEKSIASFFRPLLREQSAAHSIGGGGGS